MISAAALGVTALALTLVVNSPEQPQQASQLISGPVDTSVMSPREAKQALSRAREQERLAAAALAVEQVTPGLDIIKPGKKLQLTTTEARKRLIAKYRAKDMTLVPEDQQDGVSFNVASFNILGFDHTRPGGKHAKYPDGYTRMRRATAMIRDRGLSVVGLQESQVEQINAFRSQMPGWGVYPGITTPRKASQNSLVWNTAVWEVVETHTIIIPYFHWEQFPMPYVLLRHKESGREVWFGNFHNPASVRGPAAHIRRAAVAKEAALANRLRADGTPVIFTGDFNDKAAFFCQLSAATGMRGSNGSYYDGGCQMRGPLNIDWVVGSSDIEFSSHVVDNYSRTSRTSDHPMIRAVATLSPPSEREECATEKLNGDELYFCPDPSLATDEEESP